MELTTRPRLPELLLLTLILVAVVPWGDKETARPEADTCPPPVEPPAEPGKPTHATLELPGADLWFQASTPDKDQRLLLVVAMTRPTEAQPTAVLNPDTSTATACVKVTDFLDAQRVSTGTYDAQRTKAVRVQLPSEKITAIAARLAVPSRSWLLPDERCTQSND